MEYVCGICGKEHPTLKERMECEQSCYRKQLEEQEKAEAEAKVAERQEAIKKIEELTKKQEDIQKEIVELASKYDLSFSITSSPLDSLIRLFRL